MSPPDLPRDFARTVRVFLKRDHARIAGLHDQLLDEVSTHRASARNRIWRRFEAAVLDHMQLEEKYLLRPFREAHPEEGAALHAQHAHLRRTLRRVRREMDVPTLDEFMTFFLAHARREDPLFYVWAERALDGATQLAMARELTDREREAAVGPK